jgi:hypothetical protein
VVKNLDFNLNKCVPLSHDQYHLRDFRGLRLRRRDFEDLSRFPGDLLREAPMVVQS